MKDTEKKQGYLDAMRSVFEKGIQEGTITITVDPEEEDKDLQRKDTL